MVEVHCRESKGGVSGPVIGNKTGSRTSCEDAPSPSNSTGFPWLFPMASII